MSDMIANGIKACAAIVVGLVILLYPEKVAAIFVLIGHTLWNLAVMIGDSLHVPGEGKVKTAGKTAAFLMTGRV